VKAIVTSQLDATVGPAGRAGTRAGDAFANNLRGAVSSIGTFRMDANFQFRSGGHASGGPETAGMPRIVGERGQEIFVPSTNGYTLSHSDAMKIMSGEHGSGNQAPLIGTIIVNPGSDVSTAAARRFGVAVMDEVANGLKRQRARTPGR
jgi:hypothetical protein